MATLLDTVGSWHETAPQAKSGPILDGPLAGHLSATIETLVKPGMLLIKSVIPGTLASLGSRVELRRLGYHPDLWCHSLFCKIPGDLCPFREKHFPYKTSGLRGLEPAHLCPEVALELLYL